MKRFLILVILVTVSAIFILLKEDKVASNYPLKDKGSVYYALGNIYNGKSNNVEPMRKSLQLAAENGHTIAQYKLGMLYRYKINDKQNAEKYFQMAAEKDSSKSCYELGNMYISENDMYNPEKTLYYYEKAIALGHIKAQTNLGALYAQGTIYGLNDEKALKLLTKSSEQGDEIATYNLAIMYLNGFGVEQNQEYAIELLKRAANAGNISAEAMLVDMQNYNIADKQADNF